jgi:hypothetical protein
MEDEEDAMAMIDQPELIEPENDGNRPEAGPEAPEAGDDSASSDEDNADGGNYPSGSGFIPIAVGLASLLPLPNLSRGRCQVIVQT